MSAVAAAMASSVAVAEVSVPNTFTQGENAVAEEVNANFGALVAAIEESNERIAELENELSKASSVDVAGSGYAVQRSAIQLQRFDDDPNNTPESSGAWNIETYSEKFSLVFNDDTNQTVDFEFESELKVDLWDDGSIRFDEDNSPDSDQFYWSQDGNRVALSDDLGGDVMVEFIVAEGAGVIYALDTEVEENDATGSATCNGSICQGDYFESGTLIGIRQSSTQ